METKPTTNPNGATRKAARGLGVQGSVNYVKDAYVNALKRHSGTYLEVWLALNKKH
jgi:hypothetical protein